MDISNYVDNVETEWSEIETAGSKVKMMVGQRAADRSFSGPGSTRKSWSVYFSRIGVALCGFASFDGRCQIEVLSGFFTFGDTMTDGVIFNGEGAKILSGKPNVCFCSDNFFQNPDSRERDLEFTVSVSFRRKRDCDCPDCIDLAGLLTSPSFSDVVIEVESREFPAHKAILAARLPYFDRLFQSGMEEAINGRIRIEDASARDFEQVLRYIYSGQLPKYLTANPERLLPIADKYGLEELKKATAHVLEDSLSKENVVETMIIADLHQCPDLKRKCIACFKIWKRHLADQALEPLAKYPQLMLECIKML